VDMVRVQARQCRDWCRYLVEVVVACLGGTPAGVRLLDPTPGLRLVCDLLHCPMLLGYGSIQFPILVKVSVVCPSSFAL